MRPVHLVADEGSKILFASTNRGTILQFNFDLQLLRESKPIYGINSLYVLKADQSHLYARDITGKLVRWTKADLELDQIVDLAHWTPEDEANTPNVSHGLFLNEDFVYVSMPHGPLGKFTKRDLEFVKFSDYMPKALIESIYFNNDGDDFAVDFAGYLYRGNIDEEMKPVSRVAHGASHQIHYCTKHKRFWVTDDIHCGIALFSEHETDQFQRIDLTVDDVEWMAFAPDHSEVLVACFDRFVYRLSNTEQPQVLARLGPLNYQVKQVIWISKDIAFALTESGDIYKINPVENQVERGYQGNNAIWDIKKCSIHPDQYWLAFEDGFIRKIKVNGLRIETLLEKNLGFGMIRRLAPDLNGNVYFLAVHGVVGRLNDQMEITWTAPISPLGRDLNLQGSNLICCSESGEVILFDTDLGCVKWSLSLDGPAWAVSLSPDGKRFYVGQRLCNRGDKGVPSTHKPADLVIGFVESGKIEKKYSVKGNIKRLTWIDQDHLILNGNGEVFTTIVHKDHFKPISVYSDWQLNTCESVLLTDKYLHTTTYGFQLNTYSRDGTILDSDFPFEDYATCLISLGQDRFMAGGRGAFLALFYLKGELPHKVKTVRFK